MEYRNDSVDYAYIVTDTLIRFCDDHKIPYADALPECRSLLKKRDGLGAYRKAILVKLEGMSSLTDGDPSIVYSHETPEYLFVEIRALMFHWVQTLSRWAPLDDNPANKTMDENDERASPNQK